MERKKVWNRCRNHKQIRAYGSSFLSERGMGFAGWGPSGQDQELEGKPHGWHQDEFLRRQA